MAVKNSPHAAAWGRPVPSEQARAVDALLLALLRRLNVGMNDPVSELPLAQLRVCSILHGGPQSMSALSRELGVSVSAMTQIADRLERARLVKRVARENDRRVRCLQLTARGEKMMQRHQEVRTARMAEVLKHLPVKQRESVAESLHTMIRAAAAANGENGDSTLQGFHVTPSRILL